MAGSSRGHRRAAQGTSPRAMALVIVAIVVAATLLASVLPVGALAETVSNALAVKNEYRKIEDSVSVSAGAFAIKAEGNGDKCEGALDVGGNVENTASDDRAVYAAIAYGFSGGTGRVNVDGNVSCAPAVGTTQANAIGVFGKGDAGIVAIQVAHDVSAQSANDATGILMACSNNASATAKVGGQRPGNIHILGRRIIRRLCRLRAGRRQRGTRRLARKRV